MISRSEKVDDLGDLVVQWPGLPPPVEPTEIIPTSEHVEPVRPPFRRASEIVATPDVGRYLIDGVLRPGGLLVVGASEGLGKSQLVRELGIRGATGTGSLFGHYPMAARFRVMVLDEENGEDEMAALQGSQCKSATP